MFQQLVTPPSSAPPKSALQNVDSLFLYTSLQIAALIETVWRNRNARSATFTPWPRWITDALLATNDPLSSVPQPNFISGFDFTTSPPTPQTQWPFAALQTVGAGVFVPP